MCGGQVTINKGGILEGIVYAKAISVEKGGIFSGELFIGQQEAEQGELLDDASVADAGAADLHLRHA
jgi:cytoskeletal protein CcmA (bactofilin family)